MTSYLIKAGLIGAAAFALVLPGLSQSRDVYTVRDIEVATQGESVIAAQREGFEVAKVKGAPRLLKRLTLPEDHDLDGMDISDSEAAGLAAAVDVQEETRGGGRYVGTLSAVYIPSKVRSYLSRWGIPYTDRQAPPALLIPVVSGANREAWNKAWPDESAGRLAPYVTSRSTSVDADADWMRLEGMVESAQARRAILAELVQRGNGYAVKLTEVTPAGREEIGETSPFRRAGDAIDAASELLDLRWKELAIIKSGSRSYASTTVFFTSLAEWNKLRRALAESVLISNYKTRALSRDGAVVDFSYAGDEEKLIRDLRLRGIELEEENGRWLMMSAIAALPEMEGDPLEGDQIGGEPVPELP